MRLCILVMARTNSHELPPEKEKGRWRLGEPVDIFDADERNMNGPDGSPAFNRIYVPDWKGTLAEAKQVFLQSHSLARRELVIGDVFGKEGFAEISAAGLLPAISKRETDNRDSLTVFQSDALEEINGRDSQIR